MLDKKGFAQAALLVAILGSLVVGFFAGSSLKGGSLIPGNTSSNLMYLTNPVNSFSGKVTKIGSSDFYLSQTYTPAQTGIIALPPAAGQKAATAVTPQPTPLPKTITFRVMVGKNTVFNRSASFVPYLLKTSNPQTPTQVTLNDVQVGQMVTVSSAKDLRTVSSDEFEATQVQLPAPVNTMSGKIAQIQNGIMSVKGYLPNYGAGPGVAATQQTAAPKEETFNFKVTDETEISGNLPPEAVKPGEQPKAPTVKKYSLDELKVNQQVTVYADGEVAPGKTANALRIEPAVQIQQVTVPPGPESAATTVSPVQTTPLVPPTTAVKPTVTSASPTSKPVTPTVGEQ